MINVDIPNRPFATDVLTGLMLPDGIFESTLGKQLINAHFRNSGAATVAGLTVYVESTSHPGVVLTPRTDTVGTLPAGTTSLHSWSVDVSAAPPGFHYVSFIAESGGSKRRIIKKIFVTKVEFDATTHTFSAITPEGKLGVRLKTVVNFNSSQCCRRKSSRNPPNQNRREQLFRDLADLLKMADGKLELCPVTLIPTELETSIVPTPYFEGQYGDLPFDDPWWKILLAILAFLLLVAAAIVEATSGTGSVTAMAGCTIDPTTGATVCGPSASGGGTSYVAAGLVAAAAVVAAIAAYSDARDIHRKGQDNTSPGPGEFTVSEQLVSKLSYPEPIVPGKPFAVDVKYDYVRTTIDGAMNERVYSYSATETNRNVHVLSHYDVNAPNVVRVYKREAFLVKARFYDEFDKLFRGDQLFVKCFLFGPVGQVVSFVLQDHGLGPDREPNDGVYTGRHYFSDGDAGLWKIFVLAQDVNRATPAMKPEEAAQLIGGMLLTNQVSISFSGGTCPLVPDGDVQVVV
jgi:hypothetical protein